MLFLYVFFRMRLLALIQVFFQPSVSISCTTMGLLGFHHCEFGFSCDICKPGDDYRGNAND